MLAVSWAVLRFPPLLLLLASAAWPQTVPEVRLICLAPSPYTQRHDALRAGYGIVLSLERVAREYKLDFKVTYHDGVPALSHGDRARALLRGARTLVIGSSTWAQGSNWYVRRFFELANLESLEGVAATAWATAGGETTGGETAVADTLRTLMSMGAQVFGMGQKFMVFSTGERLAPREGDFRLLDCWYMEQFSKAIAVVTLAGGDREKASAMAQRLGYSPFYWDAFPKDEASLAPRYGDLLKQINAAADPASESWRNVRARFNH
jgi:hypothetical protein